MIKGKEILLILLVFSPFLIIGQVNVSIPPGGGTPNYLTLCGPDSTFNFGVSNATGSPMIGDTLKIYLPPSSFYVPGSIIGATEVNIGDLRNPIFILDNILNGGSVNIRYNAGISCTYDNSSATFQYEVINGGNSYTNSTSGIGAGLNPLLTFSSAITGDGAIVDVYQNGTWGITIKQTTINACSDEIYLLVDHTQKLSLVSLDAGSFSTDTVGATIYDTIILNSADLIALGDADGQLCFNETIVYNQEMKLLGCDSSTTDGFDETEARLQLGVNCNGEVCFSNEAFAALNPNLSVESVTSALVSYVPPGFCKTGHYESYITNTSPANAPLIDVEIYGGARNTYFPTEVSFDSLTINGVLLDSINTAVKSVWYITYSNRATMRNWVNYYTTDFDGPGGFSDVDGDGFYDDLAPGDTLFCYFSVDYKPENIPQCVGFSVSNSLWFSGVSSGLFYNNVCGDEGDHPVLSGSVWGDRSVSTTSSIDDPNVYDGSEHTYTIDISVDVMHLQGCSSPTDSLVAKIIIPPGVVYDNTRPVIFSGGVVNVTAQSGDTVWIDISDASGNPYAGALDFPIKGDCASLSGLDTLLGGSSCLSASPTLGQFDWEVIYYCDPVNCGQSLKMYCGTSDIPWAFHCPLPSPCTGLVTLGFGLTRLTLGWKDNLATIPVDPLVDTINLKAAFNKDRVRMSSPALFVGSNTDSLYFSFQSGTVISGVLTDLTWLPQEGNLIHYDVETGTYDTIPIQPSDYTNTYLGGGVHDLTINLIGDIIANGGTKALTDQDSVLIEFDFIVSDNVTLHYLNVVPSLSGKYFQIKSGFSCACDEFSETFELGKPNFTNTVYTGYQNRFFECYTDNLYSRRGYAYRMLEPHFPNESRPYFRRDSILIRLPVGASFGANAYLRTLTRETPYIFTYQTYPIDTTWCTPGFNYALLRNDGSWMQPDIGNSTDNARLWFEFDYNVDCRMFDIPSAFQAYVTYYGDDYAWADSTEINEDHSFSQYVTITKTPASISNTVLNPTFEGIVDTACWTIQYQNFSSGNGYDVDNNWLLIESPGNDVEIHYLVDKTTSTVLPVVSDTAYPGLYYVEIGTINELATHQFDVKATYTSCNFTTVNIYRSNNCPGYPTNPFEHTYNDGKGDYVCSSRDTMSMFIDPKDINMNMIITSPSTPQNLCDSSLITIDIENTGISQAFDLSIEATLPVGLFINSGTSEIEYPKNSGTWLPLSEPVNTSGTSWIWDISNDPSNGVPNLGNISDFPNNGYKLRFYISTDCDFPAGTAISFYSNARNACGDTSRIFGNSAFYQIIGLAESNNYSTTATSNDLYSCGPVETFKVNVVNLGGGSIPGDTTLGKEVIRLTIDNSVGYDTASYNGIHNAPVTFVEKDSLGNLVVEWDMPSGIALTDSTVFEYGLFVKDPDSLNCLESLNYRVDIYFRNQIPCSSIPAGSCTKEVLIDGDQDSITINKGSVSIDTVIATISNVNATTENMTIYYEISNTSVKASMDSLFIDVYHDSNANSIIDSGEVSLHTYLDTSSLALVDSVTGSFSFNVTTSSICNLMLAVSSSKNACVCISEEKTILVPPRAVCMDAILYVDSLNSLITIDTSFIDGGSFSYCSSIQRTLIGVDTFDCANVGNLYQLSLAVVDTNGFSDTCTANVEVRDTVLPRLVCQDTTVYLAGGQYTIDTSYVLLNHSDNCGIDSVWVNQADFNCAHVGNNQVKVYVTDLSGNIDSCVSNVLVVDTIPPTVVCNDTVVYLNANGTLGIDTSYVLDSYSEDCAIDSVWLSNANFNCNNIGNNQVTLYISDLSGNTDSCLSNVEVRDTVLPEIWCLDTTIYLDNNSSITLNNLSLVDSTYDACGVQGVSSFDTTFNCLNVGPNYVVSHVTDNNGNIDSCISTVNVVDTTILTANPGAPYCNYDSSITVTANNLSSGMVTWYSDTMGTVIGTGTPLVVSNPGVGEFTYYVNSVGTCSSPLDSVTFTVQGVTAVIVANPLSGITPFDVALDASSSQGAVTDYQWDFDGDGSIDDFLENVVTTYDISGQYNLTLIVNDSICFDTARVLIDAIEPSSLIIPNVFTPNGDGSNDLFTIIGVNIVSIEVEIFNRWGQRMYYWDNVEGFWDGRALSGVEASDGTYFYILKAVGIDDEEYFRKGSFSLIR